MTSPAIAALMTVPRPFTPFLARTAVVLCCAAFGPSLGAATATVNGAITHQTIRGFGGATVFRPTTPLSTADLDTLFGTGPGQIGFTLLRIRVSTDGNWRALELANALGARARGAEVIATPWSPPAAMKTNNSLISGNLKPSSYAEYATYLNDFAKYMEANGAPLYAISVQNEPDYQVTYESCDWTPAQMLDFCRNHAGAITATRVIMPESFQFRKNISDPVLNDAIAAENIDIVGGHLYGGGLARYPLAESRGKEVWMTEYLDLDYDWASSLATGRQIHECLATANFSAYIWWYIKRYYGPLGEEGTVTKRGYVMAQFTKFVRPGYVRITATANPTAGVYVSAYQRDQLVIVAVNESSSPVTQAFDLQSVAAASLRPYVTSATSDLEVQPSIAVSNGAFTATLPASSITTFVGERILTPPVITAPPRSHAMAEGSTVVLDVTAVGEFVSYQWRRDGVTLPGATQRLLTINPLTSSHAGSYTVDVTNTAGTATSTAAVVTIRPREEQSRLINLSTRSSVGAGAAAQIAGFVLAGNATKNVLVRAIGPTLNLTFGMSGVLADPTVELRDLNRGELLASNDNWNEALTGTTAAVSAFPLVSGSKDAALSAALAPGAYTAAVGSKDGTGGIALVEAYAVDPATGPELANVSTRAHVGTGASQLIAGFVIGGATSKTVVVRATGPTLHKTFGVDGSLAAPILELRSHADPSFLITAQGWETAMTPHFARVYAFGWPSGSRDAAIVTTLPPGAYTATVRGANDQTGTALVEVYSEP